MMGWRKLWLVAWEEFLFHVRQVSFFLALGMMILLAILFSWFPTGGAEELSGGWDSLTSISAVEETLAVGETLTAAEPIGYVDLSGLIVRETPGEFENLRRYSSEARANAALQAGEIRHYYVIEEDYVNTGRVRHYSTVSASLNMADNDIERLLRGNLRAQAYAGQIEVPSVLAVDWGEQGNPLLSQLPRELVWETVFIGVIILGLFAYLVNISGALLIDALMRESSARIMEVMITTTSPGQFLGGKVLGLTLVAMLQLGVSLGVGWLVYDNTAVPLTGLTPSLVLLIFAFLGLGYLAYSGLVLMMTLVFPHISTSLQLQFFLRVFILSPAVGLFFIVPAPNSWLSVVLTLNPLTSALLMPLRLLLTAVAPAQIILSWLILLAWSGLVFWLSTRLFRAQSLLTGRRPSLRLIWQTLWH